MMIAILYEIKPMKCNNLNSKNPSSAETRHFVTPIVFVPSFKRTKRLEQRHLSDCV